MPSFLSPQGVFSRHPAGFPFDPNSPLFRAQQAAVNNPFGQKDY